MGKADNQNKKEGKKKHSSVFIFFRTLLIILVCFLAFSFIGVYAYTKATYTPEKGYETPPKVTDVIGNMLTTNENINTNILVCGLDKGETRTDVIFVVNVDTESGTVKMLSIPRDTYTEIIPSVRKIANDNGMNPPSVVKLNAVNVYGKNDGMECLELQLEDLLGIKIDNYVKFNTDAFREVVDIIDGVDMYVPQDMYYSDPVQGLYINLKEGQQHLDGDQAEQLVRFRKYPTGDLGRIEVQHQFFSAFVGKILDSETIISNAPQLIKAAFEYVDTDLKLADMLKYAKYINQLKSSEIITETVPGYPQMISGASYYIVDTSEVAGTVDEIFYTTGSVSTSSKRKKIEVSNGGNTTGLAGRVSEVLKSDGYTISNVTTYNGEQTDYTRIVVKESGMGEDLLPYFDNAVIVADDLLLDGNTDIMIILGLEQGDITSIPKTNE